MFATVVRDKNTSLAKSIIGPFNYVSSALEAVVPTGDPIEVYDLANLNRAAMIFPSGRRSIREEYRDPHGD